MALPAVAAGYQFVNLTTVCYFAASLSSHYYMHPAQTTPASLAMGPPDWSNFANWAIYRFRMFLFTDKGGVKRFTAIRSDKSKQFINHQSNALQLLNGQTSVFGLEYGGGHEKGLRVNTSSRYVCSSGVDVNIVSHPCWFRCYPVVTFYGSDVVEVSIKDGKVLFIVQGQVVVVEKNNLPQFSRKKRVVQQGPPSQKEQKDYGSSDSILFVMDKYKYDMGTHVLHAATFRNIETNLYLSCSLDSNHTVSKLGVERLKQKSNRIIPGTLSEPDSRFFILETLSPSTVYLRCHEDPEKIVNASITGLTTTIDASKTKVKTEFILKRPVSTNFSYDGIMPRSEGKPTDLCVNSAPCTLTLQLTVFLVALFLVVCTK